MIINKFIVIIISIVYLSSGIISGDINKPADVKAQNFYSPEEIADGIIEWKKNSENLSASYDLLDSHLYTAAGTPAADWYAIASGMIYKEKQFPMYLEALYDFVNEKYDEGILENSSPIDFHRIILAINSLGGDASRVPAENSEEYFNLISDFVYNRNNLDMLINTLSWGLIALDSLNYDVPADFVFDREKIIGEIINLKIPGKGYSLTGNVTDPDVTAMVIQALAPYYYSNDKYILKSSDAHGVSEFTAGEVIDECLEILSAMQLESGDFRSWGNRNSQTGAQVIIALSRLGINPLEDERFIKNGITLIDGLMNYRLENKGFSNLYDSDRADSKAGEQALLAMSALLLQDRGDYIYAFESKNDEKEDPTSEITSPKKDSGKITDSGEKDIESKAEGGIFVFFAAVFAALIFGAIIIRGRKMKRKY